MISIKLQCACGQKYAFDVEPVNGMMPWTVACPVCGLDSTAVANQVIAQAMAAEPAPATPSTSAAPAAPAADSLVPAVPSSSAPGLRLRSAAPPEAPAPATDPSLPAAPVSPRTSLLRPSAGSGSDSEGEKWKWWYYVLGGIFIAGHSIWQAYDQERIRPLGELFGAAGCIAVGIWDFQRKRKK
jgi:hypothetical protein